MSVDMNDLKRLAAEKAVESVQSGMVIGLGTGSTAVHAVNAIGRRLQEGSLTDISAIPTSEATRAQAESLGIPLTDFAQHPVLDLSIDGADEIGPDLALIKGLGGALLREKVVETASKQFIVIADHTKLVDRLGTKAPVPVEVVPFAEHLAWHHLTSLGSRPDLRRTATNDVYLTDNGNIIFDCTFKDGLDDPAALAHAIEQHPGVMAHGLFLGIATQAIVAAPHKLHMIVRES